MQKKALKSFFVMLGLLAGLSVCVYAPISSAQSTEFPPPLKYKTVEEFLGNALATAKTIIVLLALVFIVIGGLMYVTSAGESAQTEKAKKAISSAVVGLAIVLAAPSFLKEIGTIIGWNSVDDTPLAGSLTLTEIATNLLSFLMSVIGIISLIMLLIASIMYLTSAGDEGRIDTGKKIFKYSLLGIVIAMSSLVIVKNLALLFV